MMLLRGGHQIATATNAKEALEAYSPGCFDVVVTDVVMPEMDGHELARQIAARCPRTSRHPHFWIRSGLRQVSLRQKMPAAKKAIQT